MQSRLLDTQTAALLTRSHQLTDKNGVIKTIDKRDTGNYTIRYYSDSLPDFQSSPFLFRNYQLADIPKTVDCNYSLGGK